MQNKGLMIINHNTPCACACRYCFYRSCKKADGIEYFRGEKIALKFNEWRKSKSLNDFFLSYTISHCADYTQLVDNIKINQSFDFIGAKFLQINGIGIKNDVELRNYLESVKNAGVINVDTTFFGLSDYHDRFASRNGDFNYLLKIVQTVKELRMTIQPTIAIFDDNKDQIAELLSILDKYMTDDSKVSVFLQDYRGNGENLENIRLTKSSYEALPDNVRKLINISRYRTEQEWLQLDEWHEQVNRNLVLSLRLDTIEMIESMSCDEIIDYLIDLDEKYYSSLPSIEDLSKMYGDAKNQRLYRQRDLYWKWQKQFIKENGLQLHDVTDERLCGSFRY